MCVCVCVRAGQKVTQTVARARPPLCTSLCITSVPLWPTSSGHSLLNSAPLPVSLSFCFITSFCFNSSIHCISFSALKKKRTAILVIFGQLSLWGGVIFSLLWPDKLNKMKAKLPKTWCNPLKVMTSTGSSLCPTVHQTSYPHLSTAAHFASAPCHTSSASHCLQVASENNCRTKTAEVLGCWCVAGEKKTVLSMKLMVDHGHSSVTKSQHSFFIQSLQLYYTVFISGWSWLSCRG